MSYGEREQIAVDLGDPPGLILLGDLTEPGITKAGIARGDVVFVDLGETRRLELRRN